MTVLGIALLGVLGVTLSIRPAWLPVVLGVAAGLPASAGVAFGENGVPLFSVAAAGAVVVLVGSRRLGTAHWTANAFAVLIAWSAVITALGPWLFAGIRVLVPRGGVDEQVLDPGTLQYSVSTVAQFGYLALSACATLHLVRVRGAVTAAAVALVVGTVLSSIRGVMVAVGADVLAPLVDTMPNIQYSETDPGDRLRGVLSEPSELATFSLAAAAFAVVAAMRANGRRRLLWAVVCALACSNLLQASSGTAVVASAVFIAFGVVVLAVRYVVRGGTGTPWLVIGLLVAGIVALTAGDRLLAPVQEIVADKVGSTSYNARTGADTFSWGVVADTLGLGTGLGGNRPSSFALALLSTLGIPGTVAFTALAVGIVVAAVRTPRTVPAGIALVALLVAKVVGTPDFSTPILWVLIAACAVPAWTRDQRPAPDTGLRPGPGPGPGAEHQPPPTPTSPIPNRTGARP